MAVRYIIVLVSVVAFAACSNEAEPVAVDSHRPGQDLGLLWIKHAAEYEALSMQAYHQAERALSGFIADKNWTALPGQADAGNLPPAVILDVDETVLSGIDFQLSFERPITQEKLDSWYKEHAARPVAGFTRFANAARAAGVELFFVTNRPCEQIDGVDDPCPYETTVLDAILQTGIETDADHVMLAYESPGWDKEKLSRRQLIAESYRVIMLFGDDLSDFIPCVRAKPAGSCTDAATPTDRDMKALQFSDYWGNGWYILPNPMHGSWTSAMTQ